jgi:TatD DNase family protein
MLIDTHCHLNFKAFKSDLSDVIERAKKSGIERIIIPGAKIETSKKAVEISSAFDSCFAAIGIHPHHTDEFIHIGKETLQEILFLLIKNKKVAAIGEIGLDYYTYKGYPIITDELNCNKRNCLHFN